MYTFLTGSDREIVKAVVDRLPADVRDFVDDRCQFVCPSGSSNGQMIELHGSRWLIILMPLWRCALDNGLSLHADSIIAHEIAHAWLAVSERDQSLWSNEVAVWAQVDNWGFDVMESGEERDMMEDILRELMKVLRPLNATALVDTQGD